MAIQREIEIEKSDGLVQVAVGGNLHVRSGEGTTIRVESRDAEPRLENKDGMVRVGCDDDCILYAPPQTHLTIEVGGDLTIDARSGNVEIVSAGGNVNVAGVGKLGIKEMGGDLRVAQAAEIDAEEVRGDAHMNNVQGPVAVNSRGDVRLHHAEGLASINCKGDAHLSAVTGGKIEINAKGDTHVSQCRGEIAVNTAGNVNLHEVISQRVRAVSKGDIRVHFSEAVGGQAKIVSGGDLHVRNGEKMLRKSKGVYTFRFGEGDASLALVSKGDTVLEGVDVAEGNLRGINEEIGNLGAELGAELGAMGAEMGREFSSLGRDIARQVQDKLQRKLQTKMRDIGKRASTAEWGEGKSWSFSFGDAPKPPKPPKPPVPPVPPGWDAPFDAVEEVATGEPVSEEERSLVLRMLEEGKISAAEAATLLEALGDAE